MCLCAACESLNIACVASAARAILEKRFISAFRNTPFRVVFARHPLHVRIVLGERVTRWHMVADVQIITAIISSMPCSTTAAATSV